MHPEAYNFLGQARRWLGDISQLRILEFGAHDVNGSPRRLFEGCQSYTGLDPWIGPGVDICARAQELDYKLQYDLVISAEVLEHDPDWQGQIDAAHRALQPGGKLIITCAAEPRAPHRCDGSRDDLCGEHYSNIDWSELIDCLLPRFRLVILAYHESPGDIYVLAEKRPA